VIYVARERSLAGGRIGSANDPSPESIGKTLVRCCRCLLSARVRKLVSNNLPHLFGCNRLFSGA
jgi:hypothetical protein